MTKTKQKQNINRTETKIKLLSIHTHTHTHTQTHPTKRRNLRDVSVFCPFHIQRRAAVKLIYNVALQGRRRRRRRRRRWWWWWWWWRHTHGWGWLYISGIKNIKRKNKRHFGVRSKLSKRKILICIFLPSSTFELLNPYPQRIAKGPHRAETSLQVVCDTCNKAENVWYLPSR